MLGQNFRIYLIFVRHNADFKKEYPHLQTFCYCHLISLDDCLRRPLRVLTSVSLELLSLSLPAHTDGHYCSLVSMRTHWYSSAENRDRWPESPSWQCRQLPSPVWPNLILWVILYHGKTAYQKIMHDRDAWVTFKAVAKLANVTCSIPCPWVCDGNIKL